MNRCLDCGADLAGAHWARKRCEPCARALNQYKSKARNGSTRYKLERLKGGDARCQRCGCPLEYAPGYATQGEIHHIVPLAQGGTGDPSNLMLLCVDCHHAVEGRSW